jgi:uncharacterized FlgJ-related protein
MKSITLLLILAISVQVSAQNEKRVFFNLYDMEARYLQNVYDIPYHISMSIAAVQSGFGKSNVYKQNNNPFGLKDENGKYKKYKNQQDGWIDFAETLRKKGFKKSDNFRQTIIRIGEVLYQDSRPEWSGEVIRILLSNKKRLFL